MKHKFKFPWILLVGPAVIKYIAIPVSQHIANLALVRQSSKLLEEFRKSLDKKQESIYLTFIRRTKDLERFSKQSQESIDIQQELLDLTNELQGTLSQEQKKLYSGMSKVADKILKRMEIAKTAIGITGGALLLLLEYLNNTNKL